MIWRFLVASFPCACMRGVFARASGSHVPAWHTHKAALLAPSYIPPSPARIPLKWNALPRMQTQAVSLKRKRGKCARFWGVPSKASQKALSNVDLLDRDHERSIEVRARLAGGSNSTSGFIEKLILLLNAWRIQQEGFVT